MHQRGLMPISCATKVKVRLNPFVDSCSNPLFIRITHRHLRAQTDMFAKQRLACLFTHSYESLHGNTVASIS